MSSSFDCFEKEFPVLTKLSKLAERSCYTDPTVLFIKFEKSAKQSLHLFMNTILYTYDELAAKINKTRETVRTNLRALEKMNLLSRNGADKNGFWIVHL